ncbi:MAG: hypothetical protein IJC84_02975 [Clostridia bacterium]|nr:hypothetical protein [Clostridia bacterium]
MAKVTVYKNSKFATFLSIIGYLLVVAGVYFAFNDYVVVGIVLAIAGFGVKVLAGVIDGLKQQKAIKRQQEEQQKLQNQQNEQN